MSCLILGDWLWNLYSSDRFIKKQIVELWPLYPNNKSKYLRLDEFWITLLRYNDHTKAFYIMDILSNMLTNIKIISKTLLMGMLCILSLASCIHKGLDPLNLRDVNTLKSWKTLDQNFSSNDQSFLFSNSSFHDNSFNSVSPSFDHVDLDNI